MFASATTSPVNETMNKLKETTKDKSNSMGNFDKQWAPSQNHQRYGEMEKRMKSLSIRDDDKVGGRSGGQDFDFWSDDEEQTDLQSSRNPLDYLSISTVEDPFRKYNIKYLHHEYRQHNKDHISITNMI